MNDQFPRFWLVALFFIGLWETYRAQISYNPPGSEATEQLREDYVPVRAPPAPTPLLAPPQPRLILP